MATESDTGPLVTHLLALLGDQHGPSILRTAFLHTALLHPDSCARASAAEIRACGLLGPRVGCDGSCQRSVWSLACPRLLAAGCWVLLRGHLCTVCPLLAAAWDVCEDRPATLACPPGAQCAAGGRLGEAPWTRASPRGLKPLAVTLSCARLNSQLGLSVLPSPALCSTDVFASPFLSPLSPLSFVL